MVGALRAGVKRAVGAAGRRMLVWGAVLAAAALVLDFVPLFDLLGYDVSFAVGLLAAFAGADIGQGVVAEARRAGRAETPWALAARAVARALAALVAPLLLSLANGLRVRNCNLEVGFAFFGLLPVGTVLFAAPAGVVAGIALASRPRRARAAAWLLPVASLAWALLRLYREPPVYAFDPFGGYFPGPIYDEALRPPERLLWFRGLCLVWAAAALAVAEALRTRARRAVVGAAVLAAAAVAGYASETRLGFHRDRAALGAVLSREVRSPHFVLRLAGDAGRSPDDIDLDLRDLEFRYDQLRRLLGVEPAGPITVWQFASAGVKKDLVGAGATLYARPWSREIFVQADRFPSGPLRHELAHVFAGAFGDPMFGVSLDWRLPLPRLASGLIEGVAEAADFGDPDGGSTLHQEARAIVTDGRAPPLRDLVGAGFSAVSGARAYTLAGSFCRWLLDTRGAARLRAVYRSGGDFEGVYGESVAALEAAWKRFLDTQPVDERERAAAKERFRRPAIFKKVCARELAARAGEARGLLRAQPERAVRLLEETCREDPGEPGYRLDLAEALAAAGQGARSLAVLGAVERDPDVTDPLRARAANLAAAVAFHAGDFDAAGAALERVRRLSPDEGEQRVAEAKLLALRDADGRATLGRALFGDGPGRGADPVLVYHLMTEFAAKHPDDPLGPYLVGRQLVGKDPARAIERLTQADAPGHALPPLFQRERDRMLGEAGVRGGRLDVAEAAWRRLAAGAVREAERLRAADWLERVAWERARAAAGGR